MFGPSLETIERLRREFPPGTRVELTHMNDPWPGRLREGCLGTVTGVDDIGTIHVDWDCGSRLGVVFGADSCRVKKP